MDHRVSQWSRNLWSLSKAGDECVDVELDNVVDLVTVHPDIGNVDFL